MPGIGQTEFGQDVSKFTSRHGQLTADKEQKLAKIIHDPKSTEEQKQQAIDTLVEANLRLVLLKIKAYKFDNQILSSALEALFNAARGFKPGKGARFASFAARAITRQVNQDRYRDTTIIPAANIIDFSTAINNEQLRKPDLTDPQALQIILSRRETPRNAEQILRSLSQARNLQRIDTVDSDGRSFLDTLAVAKPDHRADAYLQSIVKKLKLTPLEEDILRYRIFEDTKTQNEMATDHKVCKETVRNSEIKLRKALAEYLRD